MKQMRFSKKLRFQKETVADLDIKELGAVRGGALAPAIPAFTYTKCMTQCPSNDSAIPLACCYLC